LLAGLLHALILCIPLQKNLSLAETPPEASLQAVLRTPETVAKENPALPPAAQSPQQERPSKTPRPIKQTRINAAPRPTASPPAAAEQPSAAPAALQNQENTASTPAPLPVAKPSAPRFDAAYLNNPRPNYPLQSRHQNETGKVLLKVRVSAEGYALAVDIAQSSHSSRLDHAARQAVSQWRFIPARLGDQPIVAEVIVPIIFKLDD
jgi:protein TonB